MDKRIIGASLLCLAALAICFVLFADESDSAETEPIEPITGLHGIVYDIPAEKDRTPIAGVTVTTWKSPNDVFKSTTTDNSGEFNIQYDENVKYISFSMEEFTVKGVCSELHPYDYSGLYEIVLGENPSQKAGVHDLFDSDGFTALISRTSATVFGTVVTNIGEEIEPVKNAVVTLTTSKAVLRTETDNDGVFSIVGSSGITYQMTVTAHGLVNWSSEVLPSDEPVLVKMDQKNHSMFLGLDLGHTIAIIGLLIVILVAIVTIYLTRKPEEVDGLYVVNDIKPRDNNKKD